MTCYNPINAYINKSEKTKNNKKVIVFSNKNLHNYEDIKLACGQCIGCRIARSRSWALRCVHEASLHMENCFITLTFNDENLKTKISLEKSDFQKFMKRLRKKNEKKIKILSLRRVWYKKYEAASPCGDFRI